MPNNYTNLEKIRRLTSQKSSTDYAPSCPKVSDTLDAADASGCLAFINHNYCDGKDGDKSLMRHAVACYVSDDDRSVLYNRLAHIAGEHYQSKSMRRKHSANLANAVMIDTLDKTLTDTERAAVMGVAKSTYAIHHAHVFSAVSGEIAGELSTADDLAARYWRLCR